MLLTKGRRKVTHNSWSSQIEINAALAVSACGEMATSVNLGNLEHDPANVS